MKHQICILMVSAVMLACLMPICTGLAEIIRIQGHITEELLEWVPENEYWVTDYAWLENEDDLVIRPGVRVEFYQADLPHQVETYLEVRDGATLTADASEGNQIVFTSHEENAAPGDWGFIFLNDQDSGSRECIAYLNNCLIEYAGFDVLQQGFPGAIVVVGTGSGGIGSVEPELTVFNCEIKNCTGWAVFKMSADIIDVQESYIHDNENGIYGYTTWERVTIIGNTISNNGIGIIMHGYDGDCFVDNNLLENNDYGIKSMTMVQGYEKDLEVYNNIVLESNEFGFWLQSDNNAIYMRNNIVKDCEVGIHGQENAQIEYFCVDNNGIDFENAEAGEGTITEYPPEFAGDGDFHLKYISPCINAGDNSTPNDPDDSWNDMGIYGGTYAWDPYYVLIPSYVNEFDLTLQYSTYRVMPNIHVDDGDELELEAGTTLLFDDVDLGITVNSGGTLMATGTTEHEITLRPYDENAPYWTGVLLTENSSDGSILKHLNVDNAVNGIICEIVTLENQIEESDFTNCNQEPDSRGVYLDDSDTRVHHNTFSQCKIGVGMNHSDAVVDSNLIAVEDYGIYTRGGSTWELRYNVMQNYVTENEGIHLVNAGGKLIGNQISEVCNGLYVENSDPKMKDNLIDNCGLFGMHLISASQPVMNFAQYHAANRIADCDSNEIHISGYLYPLIGEGYNDMIDATPASGDYFIIYGTVPDVQYSYDVGHNYWYLNDPGDIRARLYPPDSPPDYQITVSSWCTSSNTGYTTASWEDDLIAEGVAYEMNGQFSEAYALYLGIVADYPNHQVAIAAIRRMFVCAGAIGGAYMDLYGDYQQFESTITNPVNLFNLVRMEGNALRAAALYPEALELFDDLLTTINNITDSVFVLMDIENTEYEMSQEGGGISSFGSSFEAYTTRIKELRQLLDGAEHQVQPAAIIPSTSMLLTAYPNPFNSMAQLTYFLPEAGFTRLAVSDLQGRFVANLIEGWQDEGIHKACFNASGLSAGVYLCHLKRGEHSAIKKLILVK